MNEALNRRVYKWNHYEPLPGYKTINEIAILGGCSKQTVFNLLQKDTSIKGFRVGNNVIVLNLKQVDKLVKIIRREYAK